MTEPTVCPPPSSPMSLDRRTLLAAALAGGGLAVVGRGPAMAAGQASIAPGTRLVWVGGSASIPGERRQLEPDANGNWVDKATGQHYRETDNPGGGGMGFVVIDVLDTRPDQSLLWMQLLLGNPDTGKAASFIDANGLVPDATNILDYWLPPEMLAGMAEQSTPSLRVLWMPYPLNGRTWRALRIQRHSDAGWSQNTYDLDSGLCIATGSVTQGKPVWVPNAGGNATQGAGYTQITHTRIAGQRQTALPGPGIALPPAIRALTSLRYAGTQTASVPGTAPFPMPIEARYDITSAAPNALRARLSLTGSPPLSDRVIAAGPIGSLWMDPRTLAAIDGQRLIDQDPTTGVRLASLGRSGDLAILVAETPMARRSFGYSLGNGLLTQVEFREQIGLATMVVALRLATAQ